MLVWLGNTCCSIEFAKSVHGGRILIGHYDHCKVRAGLWRNADDLRHSGHAALLVLKILRTEGRRRSFGQLLLVRVVQHHRKRSTAKAACICFQTIALKDVLSI